MYGLLCGDCGEQFSDMKEAFDHAEAEHVQLDFNPTSFLIYKEESSTS